MNRAARRGLGTALVLIAVGVSAATVDDLWMGLDGSDTGGGISNNAGVSSFPSVAVLGAGNPVVAWQDDSAGDTEIYVREWTGFAWAELGAGSASGEGISNNSGTSERPSLAVDPLTDQPVVAWSDNSSGPYQIYVRRWSGSSWDEMGAGSASGEGISATAGDSKAPCLGFDGLGGALVAWSDATSGNTEIYVRRWDGAGWQEVGVGSASGGGISYDADGSGSPSLKCDSAGMPCVAWTYSYSTTIYRVYVRQFNGVTWGEMGTNSATGVGIGGNSPADAYSPSLGFDAADRAVVAFAAEYGSDVGLWIRRFNGSTWEEFCPGSASGWGLGRIGQHTYFPRLAFDAFDRLAVGWVSGLALPNWRALFKYRTGSSWAELGDGSGSWPGISSGSPSSFSMVVDPVGGRPIAAWSQSDEILVRTTVPGTLPVGLSSFVQD
jgi:hypothetical protein